MIDDSVPINRGTKLGGKDNYSIEIEGTDDFVAIANANINIIVNQ